tara:strand:- start:2941 stop:4623 length:1683 start_codon:yes stop_codon:yes gene_type:complete
MLKTFRIKNIISFSLFSSSLFLTYIFGELFYNSIDGTDFYRYFQYIEYFNGTKNSPTREQGLLYFWYISNFIEMSQNYYLPDKWEFIYSSAIQLGNFILYVIGLIGFYFWLVGKNISKNLIFLSFTVLNFFPPLFGGRLIMKPEILAFCLLPWILFGIDNYLKYKNKYNLYFVSLFISVLLTSKGTIALLVGIAIFYLYFEDLKKINFKDLYFPISVCLTLSTLMFFENSNINQTNIFTHKELEQYLFRAPISFLYTINLSELFQNPFRNTHSNSLIGITLIDIFGDYFNRYWDHNRSLFSQNRIVFFEFLPHPRRNISLLFSTFFIAFSLFISKSIDTKKYKKLYIIGFVTLALTSLGLFGLHFNPLKGDTVKTHYYFFLLSISFLFVIIDFLKDKIYTVQLLVISIIISASLFIFGFPKNYNIELQSQIAEKITTTVSCKVSKSYFGQYLAEEPNCLTREIATCGFFKNYNKAEEHPDGYLIFQNDDFFTPLNLTDRSGYSVTVNGYAECLNYVEGGYFRKLNIFNEDRTPFINNLVMIFSLVSIFGLSIQPKRKKRV